MTAQEMHNDESRVAESGYVMATTALMLIPMLIFAAFAVDVGSWYVEAQKIQRASDAAALAGVVWMPDENTARTEALAIAAINGYEDQPGEFDDPDADLPQVRVSRVGPQQIRVDIKAEGDVYFGSVIEGFEDPEIHRFSSSEYVLPVAFGSPTNKIGFGALELGGEAVNAWTGIMGYCAPPHWGDVRAAYYIDQEGCIEPWSLMSLSPISDKPATISNPDTPEGRNPEHDPDGFFFVVDIPEGRTATGVDVAVYDGGLCDTTGVKPTKDFRGVHAEFVLWDATDTPLDDSDIVEVATWKPSIGEGCDAWVVPSGFRIPSGEFGRYYVQVKNNEDYWQGYGDGQNYWALEARDTGAGDGTTCFTFEDPLCVGLYALDRLPVRTQTDGDVATFYLAEVGPIYEGKTLEVEMWDLGEGMDYVQFINPQGEAVPFTWRTDDTTFINGIGNPNTEHPSETCTGGETNCLNVGVDGPPKIDGWEDHGRFNGRWVTASISLDNIPTDLNDYWWEIKYVKVPNANSVDWTTWGTRVVGDPVRLIE